MIKLQLIKYKSQTFLGLLIDQKLTWKEHILYLLRKLSKSIASIWEAGHILTGDALNTLYCDTFLI